jgi:phosphate transport system substrate-binding protein
MLPALLEMATAFQAKNPNVLVEVQGGDTANGWEDLRAGRADIAAVSWWDETKPIPDGYRLAPVARDALAVIVHPRNPITNITTLQLRALFAGEILDWPVLGGEHGKPIIVSREEGSGTRAAFEARVMGERQVTLNALVMPTTHAVLDYVATHQLAAGYVTEDAIDNRVRVVPVEGSAPSQEAALGGYHLMRTLALAVHDRSAPAVDEFLVFANSSAGTEIWNRHFTTVR